MRTTTGVPRSRFWRMARTLLIGEFLLTAGTCYTSNPRDFSDDELAQAGSDWESDPQPSPGLVTADEPVASIAVEPSNVYATPGSVFELSARLWDSLDQLILEPVLPGDPPSPSLTWILTDSGNQPATGLSITPASPSAQQSVRLNLDLQLSAGVYLVSVQLTSPSEGVSGSESAKATVTVPGSTAAGNDTGAAASVGDIVSDNHVAGSAPEIALIDGMGAQCHDDTPVAFAYNVQLEDFVGGCPAPQAYAAGSVAFFSPDQRFQLASVAWQTGSQTVNRQGVSTTGSLPPLAPPTGVPLRIWRAVTEMPTTDAPVAADVFGTAQTEIAVANSILLPSRAGMQFQMAQKIDFGQDIIIDPSLNFTKPTVGGGTQTVAASRSNYCAYFQEIAHSGAFQGVGGTVILSPGLDVVYVQELSGRGFACETEGVVFVELDGFPTTLAHELAHKMALRNSDDLSTYGVGHTNAIKNTAGEHAFDSGNLLWSPPSDLDDVDRSRLSLGQLFRMNRHKDSWLGTIRSDVIDDCGSDGSGSSTCPGITWSLN